MESDETLMEAAGRGELAAFERLVRRHQATAWRMALRLLGNAADAEDVAQDALLRLLDAAPRYRPEARFTTYLYRIVSRLCLDRLRRRPPPAELPEAVEASPTPPEAALYRERDQAVAAALAALPPRQRLVIVLRYFEGLAGAEIAEIAGTSPKAVERLLARGRTTLEVSLRPLIEP